MKSPSTAKKYSYFGQALRRKVTIFNSYFLEK